MSGRIASTFQALGRRKALIPYVTAGDPWADITPELMVALAKAGADVIELGVPFSDPMADGPVIQQASERALARGIGLRHVLQMVREFRAVDTRTPVVLMGYANPVERYGMERFVADAKEAGVDGVLVVDYPPEECEAYAALLRASGIDPIFLLAPTSTEARMAQVAEVASGYVYYVSLKGVTGAGHLDADAVAQALPRIRRHIRLPVGVGFGIRDGESAKAVGRSADAVVIGSALVQLLAAQTRENAVLAGAGFVREIRAALDTLTEGTPS
jgi:tryptophan synthase alpha chain